MLKDVTLLFIGAILSLGPAVTAMAAPLYFPNAPRWIWHYAFWLGIAMFIIMGGDGLLLLFVKRIRYGTLAAGSVGLLFLAWAIAHQTVIKEAEPSVIEGKLPWKHTLIDLFRLDFGNTMKLGRPIKIGMPGAHQADPRIEMEIDIQLCEDFSSGGDFFEIHIPTYGNTNIDDRTYDAIRWLGMHLVNVRKEMKEGVMSSSRMPGATSLSSSDLSFTGRFYIYTYYDFDAIQIGELVKLFKDNDMRLDIRGSTYWQANRDR